MKGDHTSTGEVFTRMAARITFSCSDELKAELEAYAEKHGVNVSKAVCDALELLLHPSPAPTPVPTPGPPPPPPSPLPPPGPDSATLHQLQQHRVYLEALGQHTEYVRQCVEQIICLSGMPLRFPLPMNPPPWRM